MAKNNKRYWACIIGPANQNKLKKGADAPMRDAAESKFFALTGKYPKMVWSGWGNTKKRVDVLNAVWSMDESDPLYKAIVAMLKSGARI